MLNDIEDAIREMERTITRMDANRDRRAVFLYAYLIITYNVRQAIRDDMFFDGAWLSRLAAKFASLYFKSLHAYDTHQPLPAVWKITHDRALDDASVIENLLLGINAHINYDLAFGLEENIREAEGAPSADQMLRRKFDHDRVNEVLSKSIDQIQIEIPRKYGGLLPILNILFGKLDEYLAGLGLRTYREYVWENTRYLLLTHGTPDYQKVMAKIRDEALRNTYTITDTFSPWYLTNFSEPARLLRAEATNPTANPAHIPAHTLKLQLPQNLGEHWQTLLSYEDMLGAIEKDCAQHFAASCQLRIAPIPDADPVKPVRGSDGLTPQEQVQVQENARQIEAEQTGETGNAGEVLLLPLKGPSGTLGSIILSRTQSESGFSLTDRLIARQITAYASIALETISFCIAANQELNQMRESNSEKRM